MKVFKLNKDIPLEKREQINILSARCLIFLKLDQIEKVIDACRRLLVIDPDNFIGLYNLGMALKRKGEYEKALELYFKCTKIKSKDHHVWTNIAEIYDIKGNFKESRIYALKAIEINPNTYEGYFYLGNAYLSEGRVYEAIKYYKIALRSTIKHHLTLNDSIIRFKIGMAQIIQKSRKKDVSKENIENWMDFNNFK